MFKIAVLISGSGSNLKAIIEKNHNKDCEIEVVIADRSCLGLEIAKANNIKTMIIDRKEQENLSKQINETLKNKVDLIVLAGFLSILSKDLIDDWKEKIINIHPSLLPKFGGEGMYGMNIHKAVLKEKEKESGCTVHYVNEGIDTGKIILQDKIDITSISSSQELQKEILKMEHCLLPKAIRKLSKVV